MPVLRSLLWLWHKSANSVPLLRSQNIFILLKLEEVLSMCFEFMNSKRQALFWHRVTRSRDSGYKWQNRVKILSIRSKVVNVGKLEIQISRINRMLQVVWCPLSFIALSLALSLSYVFFFVQASFLTRLSSDFRKLEEKFINGILAGFAAQRKKSTLQ